MMEKKYNELKTTILVLLRHVRPSEDETTKEINTYRAHPTSSGTPTPRISQTHSPILWDIDTMIHVTNLKPALSLGIIFLHNAFFLSPYLVVATLLCSLELQARKQSITEY